MFEIAIVLVCLDHPARASTGHLGPVTCVRQATPHCRFDPYMRCEMRARRPISGSEYKPNLPEPRLKFVLMLMGRNLKNSFVFATLAFLPACQTPQASNQQDRPARTGQSSSPSSQYEVEPISGIQRPLGGPGTFQPGSGRGP